jgi:hypothetical protein
MSADFSEVEILKAHPKRKMTTGLGNLPEVCRRCPPGLLRLILRGYNDVHRVNVV